MDMTVEIFGIDLEAKIPLIGISLWQIIMFLMVLIVGLILVKAAAYSIKKSLLKAKAGEILAEFVARLVRIILYIFVVGTALGFLGINIGTALVSISVVMGLVLGFALGDTLSNVASGFMIAITKPFKAGDFVTVSGQSGVVKNVGISQTIIDTPDNKNVIIPNKSVWGGPVINFTRHKIRRVDMEVGVSYNDDLDKVIKTTTKILKAHPKVLKDPAIQVAVNEMGDSSVNLVVRPWTSTENYWDVYFELKKSIKEAYDKAKISIPYPQMDVHMSK
jgi:small-conductance mechanosensitive channel